MTRNADMDHLVQEAKRICSSIDGRIAGDQLRQQFCLTLARKDPTRRELNKAFARAVEWAQRQYKLSIGADSSYWLYD
jgi:hypothetical protein